jgi:glutaryl-CoA dehydrogenase
MIISKALGKRSRKMSAIFNWADPLLLDDLLSLEEKAIQETAHDYAQEHLKPRIIDAFRHEHFDVAILKEMGKLGLLGATIEGYDCPGINYVSYGLIMREIERVDSGYRSAISVQSSLVMYPIYAFWE